MNDQDALHDILGYASDIYVALKGIAEVLDAWSQLPASGRITLGTESYRMTETLTPIPADDVPAHVDWYDRLGSQIQHDKTDTTWSAEDQTGAPSSAVVVDPDLDSDSTDETATVIFNASTGQFRVVATTPGASGEVRAQSEMYEIQPGAPAVGVITLSPA